MKLRLHKKMGRFIRRYFRRKILSNYGKGILVDTKNGNLVVDPGDFGVSRSLLENGEYDSRHIDWLKNIIGNSAGSLVFVGAHIGSLLVPLSSYAKTVLGYEADPKNYELLKLNIALNNVKNAHVSNKAIGAKSGRAIVVHNPLNTGNSSILEKTGSEEDVELATLDSELKSFPEERVDLLVMDIEGHELYALKGSIKVLENIKFLDMEFAPEQLAEHNSDPIELLNLVFNYFDYMYILRDTATKFNREDALSYLKKYLNKKGFLINLLFSKKEIPITEK